MKVHGKHFRTIWIKDGDDQTIQIIDQRKLPHEFIIEDLTSVDQMCVAIKDMHLRGAGLIGAAAGYGMYLSSLEALKHQSFEEHIRLSAEKIISTRPTAVNLAWAVNRQLDALQKGATAEEKIAIAYQTAGCIADEDADFCKRIGEHGLKLIREIQTKKKDEPINILTHCNAGWLAFVDYGSATAPIYAAHDLGIKVHVWVDETRPRNQGAKLTAWELHEHGVPHTVITDNTGGHLMQHGKVDLVITGTDRTTFTGDVCNKIGTYLKALAARDNNIPFYVALPSSSFDWKIRDGLTQIPIEQRDENEVKYIEGLCEGNVKEVLLTPSQSPAANFGFDVTPSRLVTGLITERGICAATEESIMNLFPEHHDVYEENQKSNSRKQYTR
ncbi:MAG TPA: S-methyl-5-thioribose-1-phosphate isomerase [Cyclobacteriaceae bacterium]|nr:S-methyl-5-thioribose-1-phosphate isomerase [Cyclobacteriaceae bacterium]